MFVSNETAPGGAQPSATQLQLQLIAGQANVQRVSAMASGEQSGETGLNSSGGRPDTSRLLREAVQKSGAQRGHAAVSGRQQPERATAQVTDAPGKVSSFGAEARSIIEAQEEMKTATTVTAAFQARYALTDLLSVIRDPEDKMLPRAPKQQAARL